MSWLLWASFSGGNFKEKTKIETEVLVSSNRMIFNA